MTTTDYALIISVFALIVSFFALIWNVWQKFIFVKPNLQVSFGVYNVLQPTPARTAVPSGQRLLVLTVTNMGPGAIVLYACIVRQKRSSWWKRPTLGSINPIHGDPTAPEPISVGPFSSGLPTKIDAGDTKTFYFPYTRECFLADGVARVGINDTYQRNTWCRRGDIRKANSAYRRDFLERGL
jgi:hypothetical protein